MADIKFKNRIKAEAGVNLPAESASKALTVDGSGNIASSAVTTTELGYVSGVTSAIQTQFTNKADASALTAHTGASSGVHGVVGSVVGTTDTQTLTNKTIDADSNTITNIENADIKAAAAIDASKIADGSVSNAEFQYLDGVTSSIQTQLDDKISSTEKGANNGVATLDGGGKIPVSQLPNSVMEYKGNWDADTNSPTLADGVGNAGDVYRVSVAGTQDLGSGNITFAVGDWVVYNGTIWEKSTNSNAVVSVNGQSGIVTLTADDVGAANQSLSNLTTTSINTDLLPSITDTISIGSASLGFENVFLDKLSLEGSASTWWMGVSPALLVDNETVPGLVLASRDASTDTENTNNLALVTGTQESTSGTSNTGSIDITSGENFGTGATGQVIISSGGNDATTGPVADTGLVRLTTGPSFLGNTGNAELRSGFISNAASDASTGSVGIYSGLNQGTGDSGALIIESGTTVDGNSGSVTLKSGDSTSGLTGNITIETGTTAGTKGYISLDGQYVTANSTRITDVSDPTASQDAATKAYVDGSDLRPGSFSAANNQPTPADITGFAFANASIRSFKAQVSVTLIATANSYETFDIMAVQKGTSWDMSVASVGDDSGIVFNITNAGQMQYTSPNSAGFVSNTIKFRATVTTV